MCFGHQKDPRYLSLSNLEGFAQQVGIGKRIIFTELRDMVDKIERERKQLVENFSGDARNRIIVSRINHVIDDRIKKTKYLLQGVKWSAKLELKIESPDIQIDYYTRLSTRILLQWQ